MSRGAVEELAAKASPSHKHAAIARPDARKGEAVVLVTDDPDLTRDKLKAGGGVPEIMLPRDVLAGREIPVLGTGKTDYVALAAALEKDGEKAAA